MNGFNFLFMVMMVERHVEVESSFSVCNWSRDNHVTSPFLRLYHLIYVYWTSYEVAAKI